MNYTEIFNRLWKDYILQNPHVKEVHDLFVKHGEFVVNDHIAFRTFNDSRINLEKLAKPFLKAGYVEKGSYKFDNKYLVAKHYEHYSDELAPRVFISELLIEDFSEKFQETVKNIINNVSDDVLNSEYLIFSGIIFGKPLLSIYNNLRQESEYAAWLYIFGFRANHFTVSVNHLKQFDSIEKVNNLLKNNGFLINDSDGEIKGTPAELLEQSSTKSGIIDIEFIEGKHSIPSCYYEFAKRYNDSNGKLYSGFIAKSADKIFESTNFYLKL